MPVVDLLVEGDVDEAVGQVLLESAGFEPGSTYGKQGSGYIRKNLKSFARAAAGVPLLVLADLMDSGHQCAPEMVRTWLPQPRRRVAFRIAVREVESWLLADAGGLSEFLGVALEKLPGNPDGLPDPKREVVRLARRSRRGRVRSALVPLHGSTAQVGPLYNREVVAFVAHRWNVAAASDRSPSLKRAVRGLALLRRTLSEG